MLNIPLGKYSTINSVQALLMYSGPKDCDYFILYNNPFNYF